VLRSLRLFSLYPVRLDFFKPRDYTEYMRRIMLFALCATCVLYLCCEDKLDTVQKRISYGIGYNLGQRSRYDYERGNIDVDYELLLRGFKDGIMKHDTPVPREQLTREIENLIMAKQGEINSKRGRSFLEQNKTKQGVVELPGGIQYRIITPGTGPKPKLNDTVVCHYQVSAIDGELIQSSYAQGKPVEFSVDDVIRGWTEVLRLMPVGSKWEVVLPPEYAYGETGSAEIGPNQTLVFELELLEIK
jgi:FKBP-type peptidyl-prolyl cis-trans isomerase FklB